MPYIKIKAGTFIIFSVWAVLAVLPAVTPISARSAPSVASSPTPVNDGFIWRHSDHTSRDVVLLIHGWNGDALTTWRALSDLLVSDPYLAQFDVATFGYSSGCFGAHPGLADVAKSLARFIDRELGRYERIYVVGHSMGGLVAKRYLVDVLKAEGRGALKVERLLLAGTPNDGVRWYVRWFGGLVCGEQVSEAVWRGAFRHRLDNEWVMYVQNGGRADLPAQNRKSVPVKVIGSIEDVLVDIPSASVYFDTEWQPGSHSGIKEPTSRVDQTYRTIVNFLRTRSLEETSSSDWSPVDVVKREVRDWRESVAIKPELILSSHAVTTRTTYVLVDNSIHIFLEKSGEVITGRGMPQSSLHFGASGRRQFSYDFFHRRPVEPDPLPGDGIPLYRLAIGASFDLGFGFLALRGDLASAPFCTPKAPYVVLGAINNNDLVKDHVIRVYAIHRPASARLYWFDLGYQPWLVSEGTSDDNLVQLRALLSRLTAVGQAALRPVDLDRLKFGRVFTLTMLTLRDTYLVKLSCDIFGPSPASATGH